MENSKEARYVVFNIGCIECGVSSKIVGLFADKVAAESVAKQCDRLHGWRDGGQNNFEVFELPASESVDAEYVGVVAEAA